MIICGKGDEAAGTNITGLIHAPTTKAAVEQNRFVVEQADPLTPLPPAGNGTFPAISGGKQQYETHVLRAGNQRDIETVFCWHGFQ
jgi:hypothetical protein